MAIIGSFPCCRSATALSRDGRADIYSGCASCEEPLDNLMMVTLRGCLQRSTTADFGTIGVDISSGSEEALNDCQIAAPGGCLQRSATTEFSSIGVNISSGGEEALDNFQIAFVASGFSEQPFDDIEIPDRGSCLYRRPAIAPRGLDVDIGASREKALNYFETASFRSCL
ncbi:hypothetical protein NEMBOFW57_002010 [Staphylotrichum longicolle]|uniref:Uncharacterized protein n=1 Tax=Staphylotrichum longicolle TaxID=669026 RepID=A0AAD4F2P0_9PEZI|nr:hypothetical protein NEMBOFW57_002010 [Staphylotrichum longicolle]